MSNISQITIQDTTTAYMDGEPAQPKTRTVSEPDAYETVCRLTSDREEPVDAQAQSVMDNFNEYRKDMQERAKSEQADTKTEEEQQQENAREIARSLTEDEIRKLRMMGVDVSCAELSDLMDMVVTMREDAHNEELANILTQARIESGDRQGIVVAGSEAKIAGSDAKLTVGQREILYLLKNDLPLDQENLYRACYSGQRDMQTEDTEPIPENMEEQMARVIAQAGILVDADSMDGARLLLANEIPVTTDTIRAYTEMHAQIGTDIRELPTEEELTDINRRKTEQKAAKFCTDVAQLTETDIADAVSGHRPVTIAAMTAARRDIQPEETSDGEIRRAVPVDAGIDETWEALPESDRLQQITYTRRLEELRLSMTQQVAVRMLRMDVNIDTRDLQQVVAKLRTAERQLASEMFAKYGVEPTEERMQQYMQMQQSLQAIGDAPAANLGRLVGVQTSITVRSVTELVTGGNADTVAGVTGDAAVSVEDSRPADLYAGIETETVRRSGVYRLAGRMYEALGTTPRADMGDNIRKAFSNIEDMLNEMNLPADVEHVRAVRILGYNSIAVTEENIEQVMWYDRQINDLITACRPEAVLTMIRDGQNPLDIPVDDLNRILQESRYQSGVTETVDFASFLRDVERRGEISEEERTAYIGMYRMINNLARSGDREAGYLFANGSRLTVRGLLTAMRSRRAAGMDISVDDTFGMLESAETEGARIDDQIAQAFPVSKTEEAKPEENLWRELPESDLLLQAQELLRRCEMTETAVNLQAASRILQDMPQTDAGVNGFYAFAAAAMRRLRLYTLVPEESVDEETGAMAQSLAGEEIPVLFYADGLLRELAQGEDLSDSYADIRQTIVDRMYAQAEEGNLTGTDLSGLKVVQAGFRILGGMAHRNQYQLPVATENGVTIVNFSVRTDETSRGIVEIHMRYGDYGSLTARLFAGVDGNWEGGVFADNPEGNTALALAEGRLRSLLVGTDYEEAHIRLGQTGAITEEITSGQVYGPDGGESGKTPDMKKLCEAAVFFVKTLVQISDISDRDAKTGIRQEAEHEN